MSNRDARLYIEDILESIFAIESYLKDIDFNTFCEDRKTYSATIREFIVIGEAVSHIIKKIKDEL